MFPVLNPGVLLSYGNSQHVRYAVKEKRVDQLRGKRCRQEAEGCGRGGMEVGVGLPLEFRPCLCVLFANACVGLPASRNTTGEGKFR